jgi:hypothetical protein
MPHRNNLGRNPRRRLENRNPEAGTGSASLQTMAERQRVNYQELTNYTARTERSADLPQIESPVYASQSSSLSSSSRQASAGEVSGKQASVLTDLLSMVAELLAALVNEILVELARRNGVDLS